ncbi:hypothetical protein GA830_03880 [Mesorhizobium sp. NBSH29]|uniref:tellurite resistance TerB family protein n=1 Tax=Mesorhizobium sp. NBSH29 TaxID=2654249 RepID=UPI0018968F30|nr:TerB family tellurite resistance protein [Mesorhizobium sp. NBSH29]QPC85968.1 hypothetical protein GA830_03880 [Mesorhizobium sp. NBSH29]
MLERLLTFLKDLPGQGITVSDADDPRVAAAALMVHVMDADGVRRVGESTALRHALAENYRLAGSELDALLAAGEKADQEAVDLYAFTSVLKRHLGTEARTHFIRILFDIVYSDGELHELEENIVWRVAELIGVEREARVAARQRARDAVAPDASSDSDEQ